MTIKLNLIWLCFESTKNAGMTIEYDNIVQFQKFLKAQRADPSWIVSTDTLYKDSGHSDMREMKLLEK